VADLLVLRGADIERTPLPTPLILELVERSIRGLTDGSSENPAKIVVKPSPGEMLIAMPALTRFNGGLALKSYSEFPEGSHGGISSTITLFDLKTGHACAFMDCRRITAARTGAVSALMARETARENATVALVVGAGDQARATVPALSHAMPMLEEIVVVGRSRDRAERLVADFASIKPGLHLRTGLEPSKEAARADVIVAAAGPEGAGLIARSHVKRGAAAILLGYGLASDVLYAADRIVATSEAQMAVTGMDLVDDSGRLPPVDAEFADVLTGRKAGRCTDHELVFSYNSGLAVTDAALAVAVFEAAVAAGLGERILGF
jgi:N-[(2S)-2-amino-2-carboxyethyl]-L-glutamate dehydrogenase